MRDEYSDTGPKPAGWATPTPILVWNPVAGASAYDLDVFNMVGSSCDITLATTHWHVVTPLTTWTPLGTGHTGALPYPSSGTGVESDSAHLVSGNHYCVRIRAVGETDSAGQRVYGDYTFLNNAFTYAPAAPAAGAVTKPTAADYLSPAGGVVTGQTPLFTWRPIAGANSYWVIVARDPSFTTLVDYGFTQIPAYAPRLTFADETTSYYWAVLPAANSERLELPVRPAECVCSEFPEAFDPAHVALADKWHRARRHPAAVPVDAGAGRAQLQDPGVDRPELRHAAGQRRYRVDGVREHYDVSSPIDALLAGAGERRAGHGAHLVEHRDVQAGCFPLPQPLAQASRGDLIPPGAGHR